MLRDLLRTNSILSFLIVIGVYLLLILPGIWMGYPTTEPSTDLTSVYIHYLTGGTVLIERIVAAIIIGLSALSLQSAISRSDIRSSMSLEPLFWFIGLSMPVVLSSDPIPALAAQLFSILAFRRMMSIDAVKSTLSIAFDSGLYISLAAFFDIHFMLMLPVLWWAFSTVKTVEWREIALSIIGVALPFYILIACRYLAGYPYVGPLDISSPPQDLSSATGIPLLLFVVLSITVFVVALATDFARRASHSLRKRKHDEIAVCVFLVMVTIAALDSAQGYNGMALNLLSFPMTLFILSLYDSPEGRVKRDILSGIWLLSSVAALISIISG